MKSNGMATLIAILSCGGIGDSNGGSGGVGVVLLPSISGFSGL
jgi:hypothetical protein